MYPFNPELAFLEKNLWWLKKIASDQAIVHTVTFRITNKNYVFLCVVSISYYDVKTNCLKVFLYEITTTISINFSYVSWGLFYPIMLKGGGDSLVTLSGVSDFSAENSMVEELI